MRIRRRQVLALALLLLLPGAGAGWEALAGARAGGRHPPPGRLVDVGGFRLHLHCIGSGSPTVVLDAGMGGGALEWALVQEPLARLTRVCAWDRAGLGWSEPGPLPRTSQRITRELHTLLEQAGEQPPYVIAGHSFGAFTARLFASRYQDEVAGVVLVDGADPDEWHPDTTAGARQAANAARQRRLEGWMARLGLVRLHSRLMQAGLLPPPAPVQELAGYLPEQLVATQLVLWSRPAWYRATASQWQHMGASAAAVKAAGALGYVPLVVITAEDNQTLGQAAMATLSSRGIQVIAEGAGHDVHLHRPDLVIEHIAELVERARARP